MKRTRKQGNYVLVNTEGRKQLVRAYLLKTLSQEKFVGQIPEATRPGKSTFAGWCVKYRDKILADLKREGIEVPERTGRSQPRPNRRRGLSASAPSVRKGRTAKAKRTPVIKAKSSVHKDLRGKVDIAAKFLGIMPVTYINEAIASRLKVDFAKIIEEVLADIEEVLS